jgi:hypothetical protein
MRAPEIKSVKRLAQIYLFQESEYKINIRSAIKLAFLNEEGISTLNGEVHHSSITHNTSQCLDNKYLKHIYRGI